MDLSTTDIELAWTTWRNSPVVSADVIAVLTRKPGRGPISTKAVHQTMRRNGHSPTEGGGYRREDVVKVYPIGLPEE